MALAVKHAARFDYEAVRVDLARSNSLVVDLHFSFRKDHAIEMAGNHYVITFDLAFDTRLVA